MQDEKDKGMGEGAKAGVDRRTFLRTSAAASAAGALSLAAAACAGDDDGAREPGETPEPPIEDGAQRVSFAPEAIAEDEIMFPLGVQAGAVHADSAILWALADDGSASKRLRVWRSAGEAGQVYLHTDIDVQAAEGYLKTRVSGLAAGAEYRYAFFDVAGDGSLALRSTIGRFRSAWPAGSTRPLLVGTATCTSLSRAPYRSMLRTAQEDVDCFFHVGDMSYNDAAYRSTIGQPADVVRAAYRQIWRATLADPGYRALLAKTGSYITWDDHEVDDNWDPETYNPVSLQAAKEAYFETLPNDRFANDRLWTSYRWGSSVEVFLLDCRSERLPSTRHGAGPAQYLSPEQMAWFKQALKDSPCHFKVVLNSVPMAKMPPPFWIMAEDRWDGYQDQRTEILDWIDAHDIANVWFISGDFHVGFVARVAPERTGAAGRVRDIAVGPGANGPNPLVGIIESFPDRLERIFPSGQFEYFTRLDQYDVATLLRFDPSSNSVHVRFIHTPRGSEDETLLYDAVLSDDDFRG